VKKALISIMVSAAMAVAPLPAMAADASPANQTKTAPVTQAAPLAPGGAAGVQLAQGRDDDNPPIEWLIGAGVVIGVGILLLTQNNQSKVLPQVPVTTTTTSSGGKAF
jgi:uncharacterized membrane protein